MQNTRPAVLLVEHLSEYYLTSPGFSPSEEVRQWLVSQHPEAWSEESSYGRELTVQRLGRMLSDSYGITSQRPDTVRGYTENQFGQVWQALGIRLPEQPARPEEPEEPAEDSTEWPPCPSCEYPLHPAVQEIGHHPNCTPPSSGEVPE